MTTRQTAVDVDSLRTCCMQFLENKVDRMREFNIGDEITCGICESVLILRNFPSGPCWITKTMKCISCEVQINRATSNRNGGICDACKKRRMEG